MTPAQYLTGVVALAIALASLGLAAGRLRQALLPEYRGAAGHLASMVLGLALLVCILQAVGSVGQFRRGVVVVAVPAVALLVAAAVPRLARARGAGAAAAVAPRPAPPAHTRAAAVLAVAPASRAA